MTAKEKRDIVFREVLKPEIKNAGYRAKGKAYISILNDCYLAILLENSRFNSNTLGFSFGAEIKFYEGEYSKDRLLHLPYSHWISEHFILTNGGFLHPYRKGGGYDIAGSLDPRAEDMDIVDIKSRITEDWRCDILPQLAEILCYDDWKRKKQEWDHRHESTRVQLLQFYHILQNYAATYDVEGFRRYRQQYKLSDEEIKGSYPLYLETKALSIYPNEDKWATILMALTPADEA